MASFVTMGGYAQFVWPAYGAAALAFIALLGWVLGAYRRRQRELDSLQRRR